MWRVSTVPGRYSSWTALAAVSSSFSSKLCLNVETSSLGAQTATSFKIPLSMILTCKSAAAYLNLFQRASLAPKYQSYAFFDSALRFSTGSTRVSYSPSNLNRGRMALRVYLGSFLALTVLMRSGISQPFSCFIVATNLRCWTSLKIASCLVKSSAYFLS